MKPIEVNERFTLSKIVSDSLRQFIIENNLSTGDKLPSERDLARMFDVSRVIVREALRSLESTGILSIRHGEGAFVNTDDTSVIFNNLLFFWQLNDDKSGELFELRHLLEKSAIEQLIAKGDTDRLHKLEDIIIEMSKIDDTLQFKTLDIEFHKALIQATENDLFIQLMDIITQYFSGVSHSHMNQDNRNKTVYEHKLILKALKDKDVKLALHYLNEHLQNSLGAVNKH
ncbi:FadR family transcriptional regulator [Bacillus sp. FJAT-50079]|nr:FadR family transcriptional regulator [Bacillus sp. FJAT-50079]